MCIACVSENWNKETKDVEYFIVGNKIFLEHANTVHEHEVQQVFVSLTRENASNGKTE